MFDFFDFNPCWSPDASGFLLQDLSTEKEIRLNGSREGATVLEPLDLSMLAWICSFLWSLS